MYNVRNINSDKTNMINIKRRFLSECNIPNDNRILFRKICFETDLETDTNYDDIYGPWKFDVPLHTQCNYPSSKLITSKDITYMKGERDKKLILSFFEEKILHNVPYKNENKEILVKLLWQTFKFFKDKLFTDQQISTVIELILSTHNFYLSNYWNTAEETYKYFLECVLLCTVMDPPKCAEIFTLNQAVMILEFFREIYMENIVLLHLVCMTQYC